MPPTSVTKIQQQWSIPNGAYLSNKSSACFCNLYHHRWARRPVWKKKKKKKNKKKKKKKKKKKISQGKLSTSVVVVNWPPGFHSCVQYRFKIWLYDAYIAAVYPAGPEPIITFLKTFYFFCHNSMSSLLIEGKVGIFNKKTYSKNYKIY